MKGDSEQKKGNVYEGSVFVSMTKTLPQIADATKHQTQLDSIRRDIVNQSPDLVPTDFHFFTSLKSFMTGKRFLIDDEVQSTVKQRAKEAAGDFLTKV